MLLSTWWVKRQLSCEERHILIKGKLHASSLSSSSKDHTKIERLVDGAETK